jgi:SAM-dependent methyltransferase
MLHPTALVYHAASGTPLSIEKRAVLERIPTGARVLEVGAHGGYFTAALRARACHVTAVEVDPCAAVLARGQAAQLIVGDAEDPALWETLRGPFDVVLFMHVLEHFVDPWAVLTQARATVGPGGRLLALLPNVACWRIRKALFVHGRFEYEETGILDRTHVRFFTLDSGRALLEATGWHAVRTTPIDVCVPLERRLRSLPLAGRLADAWHALAARRAPNLCTEIALFEAVAGEGA